MNHNKMAECVLLWQSNTKPAECATCKLENIHIAEVLQKDLKVLSLISGFPAQGTGTERRNPQSIWLWRQIIPHSISGQIIQEEYW